MKELILSFPQADQVMVRWDNDSTSPLTFAAPITDQDREDIRWYLEVYGTQYTMDMDDNRAERITQKLPKWGKSLFDAVFKDTHANWLFLKFYTGLKDDLDKLKDHHGLITIDTCDASVLSLPWELLYLKNRHLVHENPHISVRRRLTGAGGTGRPFHPSSKDTLYLLFMVSRPKGAGFLDPRADALAVMDALDQNAPSRVTVEFLRPATLDNLTHRLKCQGSEHKNKPPVDILHFDGHGVFDTHGTMIRKAMTSDPSAAARETGTELRPGTGYLLFEDDKGEEALITSETLGNMLTNQKVSLVVLSACQSGAVGRKTNENADDQEQGKAINGVAARLVGAGLPCVIAMSHTVLVETTRLLFGQFYARLGDHLPVGAALDEARQHLYAHPERGNRRRGQHTQVTLRLQDWFLPALYQSGEDVPLLKKVDQEQPSPLPGVSDHGEKSGNLPAPPDSGFFGRTVELWHIERNFITGTRRLTVTGFGGQGKTALSAEAGRWLVRSGMFAQCCFVGFDAYQGVDPVSYCTSALSVTLGQNLIDAKEAEKALAAIPTLIILDNLESLKDGTEDRQSALLDAAALWSRAGQSRVLITTRQHRLEHPGYPEAGKKEHRYLDLEGLAEHDAVACFAALWALPPDPSPHIKAPARHGLVELFRQVDFHPLSVMMLAYQLKFCTVADLGQRLEKLLNEAPGDGPEKNLRASLDLSLERLAPDMSKWLPGLGVFQGGAMEDLLLQVTGMGKTNEDASISQGRSLLEALKSKDPVAILRATGNDLPEGIELPDEIRVKLLEYAEETIVKLETQLAQHKPMDLAPGADGSTWPDLRRSLEMTGLIRVEPLPGVGDSYVKFHPALAPALWERVTEQEKERLLTRHQTAYERLSQKLYHQDDKDPHAARAVVQHELPNLLFAVKAALSDGDDDAVDFVDNINKFLNVFGLLRDRDDLNKRAEEASKPGTRSWYLSQSNKGEALFSTGRYEVAEAVFRNILTTMGETVSYDKCVTLSQLGRCLSGSGRSQEAVGVFQEAIAMAEKLEQSHGVRHLTVSIHGELATTLYLSGDYAGSRASYESSLTIAKEIGDDRGIAATEGQLGTLAMTEGNFTEAERRYKEALKRFQRLNEPATEATIQHQLGVLYHKTKQYDAAEAAYRESARIEESLGDLAGAAQTYSNLAVTMVKANRPAEAETWYRRAMKLLEDPGQVIALSNTAHNLAGLLQSDPARLDEARTLAEQALAIMETLDPDAAEIWRTYTLIAKIAEKQDRTDEAQKYRHLSREAQGMFMGTRHQVGRILSHFKPVIEQVAAACDGDENARRLVEERFDSFREGNWQIVDAIQAIWAGERDEEKLIEPVDYNSGAIIRAILATLRGEDPFPSPHGDGEAQTEDTTESTQLQHLALAAALPVLNPEARTQVEPILEQLKTAGLSPLSQAIERLWNGEKDPEALCHALSPDHQAVIQLALHFMENPDKLAHIMGEEKSRN